ncbi:MAG: alpha/beta hydrolase [Candidatus Omnitrophica bacterium]|nr:alpha/beta hydrolase [Candidatus Omnitrophota bacterium]
MRIKLIFLILATIGLSFLSLSSSVTVLMPAIQHNTALKTPPEKPDPSKFYLFYLHGKIVEGSGGNPKNPDYGTYEYFNIVNSFSKEGFVTISEIRGKNTDVDQYSTKTTKWIESLLNAGVPPSHITVVGASKGGMIVTKVSNQLKNKEIKYVFLAGLFSNLLKRKPMKLWGEILSIYDKSDTSQVSAESLLKASKRVTKIKNVITQTGKGHGLIFKPYPVWMKEVVAWSGIKNSK